MEILIDFIVNNWASLSAVIAAIGLRIFPTERNYDIFSKILKLIDLVIPNIKKGGGRHVAKLILFFVLAFGYAESYAQLNTNTRLIKFRTGVQNAIDTASVSGNEGHIWYDFERGRYRANEGGVNKFLIGGSGGSGGTVTASNGLTKTGDDIALGGTITKGTDIGISASDFFGSWLSYNLQYNLNGATNFNIHDADFHNEFQVSSRNSSTGGNILIGGMYPGKLIFQHNQDNPQLSNTVFYDIKDSPIGITYGADYSATFINESLVTKRYVDSKVTTVTASNGLTKTGNNIALGGTMTGGTLTGVTSTTGNGLYFELGSTGGSKSRTQWGPAFTSITHTDFVKGRDTKILLQNARTEITADSVQIVSSNGNNDYIGFSVDVAGVGLSRITFNDGTNRIGYIDFSTSGNYIAIGRGGNDVIRIDNGNNIIYPVLRSNCTGAPSGAMWNDSGILKICP